MESVITESVIPAKAGIQKKIETEMNTKFNMNHQKHQKHQILQNLPNQGALLIIGPIESGTELAFLQAESVLCGSENYILFKNRSHPDFKVIQIIADEGSKSTTIKIDQIRELIDWSLGKPQMAACKVAIIVSAHTMTLQAANALLKTLEEPNTTSLFILVSDRPSLLPITIRSRCYKIRCPQPQIIDHDTTKIPEEVENDLNKLSFDPIATAARWQKYDIKQLLFWILSYFSLLAKKEVEAGNRIESRTWWDFIDHLYEARRQVESPSSPNVQLLLESLLIRLVRKI